MESHREVKELVRGPPALWMALAFIAKPTCLQSYADVDCIMPFVSSCSSALL